MPIVMSRKKASETSLIDTDTATTISTEPIASPSGRGRPSAGRKLSWNQSLRKNTVTPTATAIEIWMYRVRRRKVAECMINASLVLWC
ncbi:MAG: hypothetical protein L6Q70_10895 [Thauera sp.]|nr:hypothetical protein [Thauera sp.]